MQHFLALAVAGTERWIQFKVVHIVHECWPNGEQDILKKGKKKLILLLLFVFRILLLLQEKVI